MQKLTKKTRHYQTLVPVEAYQVEEDQGLEKAYFWTLWVTTAAVSGIPCVGHYAAAAIPIVDHYFHDEMVDAFKGVLETTFEALEEVETAVRRRAGEFSDAIADGIKRLVRLVMRWIMVTRWHYLKLFRRCYNWSPSSLAYIKFMMS